MRNLPTPEPAGGDSRPALPPLPGCGRPATARIELYADITYKSLDGSIYLCVDHAPITVAAAVAFTEATGLTPFRVPTGPGKRCGDGFDFLAMQPLDAPAANEGTDEDVADVALRALFPKGHHPVVDAAEDAVRRAADMHGPTLTRQGAEAILATLEGRRGGLVPGVADLTTLTGRERAGLLARFGRESVCATCHGAIEFVPKPATSGPAWGSPYYRHLAGCAGSHIARPAVRS